MVECFLAKEDVAGSTPVSRSNTSYLLNTSTNFARRLWQVAGLRRGTQVVRERSAKPLCVGSIPTRASNIFRDLAPGRGLCCWCGVGSFVGTVCIGDSFWLYCVIPASRSNSAICCTALYRSKLSIAAVWWSCVG